MRKQSIQTNNAQIVFSATESSLRPVSALFRLSSLNQFRPALAVVSLGPGHSRPAVLVLAPLLPPAVGPGPPPASEAALLEPFPPRPAPSSSRPLRLCLTRCAETGHDPPPLDGPEGKAM